MPKKKVNEQTRDFIFRRIAEGKSCPEIAKEVGLSERHIRRIVSEAGGREAIIEKYRPLMMVNPPTVREVSTDIKEEDMSAEKKADINNDIKREDVSSPTSQEDSDVKSGFKFIEGSDQPRNDDIDISLGEVGIPENRSDTVGEEEREKEEKEEVEEEHREEPQVIDMGEYVIVTPKALPQRMLSDLERALAMSKNKLVIEYLRNLYGDASVNILKGLGAVKKDGAVELPDEMKEIIKTVVLPVSIVKAMFGGGNGDKMPIVIMPKGSQESNPSQQTVEITMPNGITIKGTPDFVNNFMMQQTMQSFANSLTETVKRMEESIKELAEKLTEKIETAIKSGTTADAKAVMYNAMAKWAEAKRAEAEARKVEEERKRAESLARWNAIARSLSGEEEGSSLYDVLKNNIEKSRNMVIVEGESGGGEGSDKD